MSKAGSNCTRLRFMQFTALEYPSYHMPTHLPLVVLNVSTANTTNTAALQQSMQQASVLSNNLDTVTGPLMQHTVSTTHFSHIF